MAGRTSNVTSVRPSGLLFPRQLWWCAQDPSGLKSLRITFGAADELRQGGREWQAGVVHWSQSVAADNIAEYFSAATHRPELRFGIECHQSEAQLPTFVPLEIVGQGPVQIASNVVSLCDQAVQLAQDIYDQPGTNLVFRIGHTVFHDVNRLRQSRGARYGIANRLGIGLSVGPVNPGIALRDVRRYKNVGKECFRTPQIKSNMKPSIHIQADEIA